MKRIVQLTVNGVTMPEHVDVARRVRQALGYLRLAGGATRRAKKLLRELQAFR